MQKVLQVFLILFGIGLSIITLKIMFRILLLVLVLIFSILFPIGLVLAMAGQAVWERFVKRGKAC
ncbi:MAG: hypothetical protein QXY39_05590 [Thermofilaceae archaeon]